MPSLITPTLTNQQHPPNNVLNGSLSKPRLLTATASLEKGNASGTIQAQEKDPEQQGCLTNNTKSVLNKCRSNNALPCANGRYISIYLSIKNQRRAKP